MSVDISPKRPAEQLLHGRRSVRVRLGRRRHFNL
jgi:hypothetical protein